MRAMAWEVLGRVPDRRGPEHVRELLGDFLRGKGLRKAILRVEATEDWGERVGDAIARVTRARGVRDATLIVEVRSSAWLMELDLMKGEILRRINEGREEAPIEKIVFVLSEKGEDCPQGQGPRETDGED